MTAAEAEFVQPDPFDPDVKWMIKHNRMTDSLTFGPFDSLDEAIAWAERNGVQCNPQPMLPPRVEEGGYHGLWAGWRR